MRMKRKIARNDRGRGSGYEKSTDASNRTSLL